MKINGRELKLERGKDKPEIAYYNGKEINLDDFECRTIGEGYIMTELKNNVLFYGTLSEWAAFKKKYPEMLTSEQLLNEVV